MGQPDDSLPQVVYPKSELMSNRRWKHSQVLAHRFYTAFVKTYLLGLETRGKWQNARSDISVRMVVMLVDPQLLRSLRQIGRVVKIFQFSFIYAGDTDIDSCLFMLLRQFKVLSLSLLSSHAVQGIHCISPSDNSDRLQS